MKLSDLHFFQTARKATMRQPVIKTKQPSLKSVGVFDFEHNLTVTKQLHTVKPQPRAGDHRHAHPQALDHLQRRAAAVLRQRALHRASAVSLRGKPRHQEKPAGRAAGGCNCGAGGDVKNRRSHRRDSNRMVEPEPVLRRHRAL